MYGPATEPPPQQRPRRGGEWAMRVLFASFPILSCGLLAWLPALRLAILRMSRRDWGVFAVVAALNAGYVITVILVPTSDEEGVAVLQALAGLYILGFIIGCVVHAMVAGRTPLPPTAGYPGSAYPTAYPVPGGPPVPPGPAPSGPARSGPPLFGAPLSGLSGPASSGPGPSAPGPSTPGPSTPGPSTPTPAAPGSSAPAPGPPAPTAGPPVPPSESAFSPPVVVSPVVSPEALVSPEAVVPPGAVAPPAAPVPRMQQVRSELDELGERLRQRGQP